MGKSKSRESEFPPTEQAIGRSDLRISTYIFSLDYPLGIADADVYPMKSKDTKHTLVYDGACDFCNFCINRWKHLTKDRIVYAPYQAVSHQFSDIPISDFQTSVQFILDDGQVYSGAEAIFRALDNGMLIWFYEKLPGFAKITEIVYRFVAENRSFFSRITRLFFRTH